MKAALKRHEAQFLAGFLSMEHMLDLRGKAGRVEIGGRIGHRLVDYIEKGGIRFLTPAHRLQIGQ